MGKWHREHREEQLEYLKQWRKDNPDKCRQYSTTYELKHAERIKPYKKKRYAAKKEEISLEGKKRYLNNKEDMLQASAEYYAGHQKEKAAYAKAYGQTPRGKYNSYKNGAKSRSISFSLTFEEFATFWQKSCWYANCAINTIGLDRIDSTGPYSLSNVIPCCERHNKAKWILTQEEYILDCNKIAKKHPRNVTE